MGQKVNPISNRLGIIRGWDSNWYGGNDYGDSLLEDSKIRKYLNARLAKASVSRIVIERTLKLVTITVCTARPGIIIGKGGQEVDKLKEELKKVTDKDIQINIFEVKRPELDAVAIQIYDRRVEELPAVGLMKIKDAETGHEQWIDTSSRAVRRAHRDWWVNKQTELNDTFTKSNVDNVSVRTDQDYVKALMNLFAKRN